MIKKVVNKIIRWCIGIENHIFFEIKKVLKIKEKKIWKIYKKNKYKEIISIGIKLVIIMASIYYFKENEVIWENIYIGVYIMCIIFVLRMWYGVIYKIFGGNFNESSDLYELKGLEEYFKKNKKINEIGKWILLNFNVLVWINWFVYYTNEEILSRVRLYMNNKNQLKKWNKIEKVIIIIWQISIKNLLNLIILDMYAGLKKNVLTKKLVELINIRLFIIIIISYFGYIINLIYIIIVIFMVKKVWKDIKKLYNKEDLGKSEGIHVFLYENPYKLIETAYILKNVNFENKEIFDNFLEMMKIKSKVLIQEIKGGISVKYFSKLERQLSYSIEKVVELQYIGGKKEYIKNKEYMEKERKKFLYMYYRQFLRCKKILKLLQKQNRNQKLLCKVIAYGLVKPVKVELYIMETKPFKIKKGYKEKEERIKELIKKLEMKYKKMNEEDYEYYEKNRKEKNMYNYSRVSMELINDEEKYVKEEDKYKKLVSKLSNKLIN